MPNKGKNNNNNNIFMMLLIKNFLKCYTRGETGGGQDLGLKIFRGKGQSQDQNQGSQHIAVAAAVNAQWMVLYE